MTLNIQEQFGHIDIYVFDQILRGNIAPGMRVLDAGCGYGRNLVHLLREGCDVFALDLDPDGVEHVRRLSASLGTGFPAGNFQVGSIEQMPFPDGLEHFLFYRRPLRVSLNQAFALAGVMC
jgi:SAM-dependent methyltransferase